MLLFIGFPSTELYNIISRFSMIKVSNKDFCIYPSSLTGKFVFPLFCFFLSNLSFDTRLLLFIIKYSFNIFKRQNTIKSSIVLDHKLYGLWDSLMDGQFTPGKRFRVKCQQILKEIWANFLFKATILAITLSLCSVS